MLLLVQASVITDNSSGHALQFKHLLLPGQLYGGLVRASCRHAKMLSVMLKVPDHNLCQTCQQRWREASPSGRPERFHWIGASVSTPARPCFDNN